MTELIATHRYDDIIHQQHPVSSRHAAMTKRDRAAQFAPFAALTGYEQVIAETARRTESRIELEENEIQALDWKLRYLQERIREQPEAEIVYFEPDAYKEGGCYRTAIGYIRKIDMYQNNVLLVSGQEIPIKEIVQINF